MIAESVMDVPGVSEVDLSYVKGMGGGISGEANSMNKGA